MNRLLDFLIPPHCVSCHGSMESDQGLCGACWRQIHFISNPYCHTCGLPLPFGDDNPTTMLCGPCTLEPPPYDLGRSCVAYDAHSKDLILRFKHGDHTSLTPFFVKWLEQTGKEIMVDVKFILPVPLHWTRLLKRRYNQAALLSKGLSHKTGIPYLPTTLKRIRATPPQGHLSKEERQKNVENSFSVSDKGANILEGQQVLLIDDVLTSGATIHACTKVLKNAGVTKVSVLTLARVVRL